MNDRERMKLGFIGLGNIGNWMCRRLLESGYPVSVCDIDASAVERMAEVGATSCQSPEEVAAGSDVVLTSLPNAAIVEQVVFGEGGLARAMRDGKILIDLSSSMPSVTRRVGEALQRNGAEMLDTPVSRGVPAAKEGTLSIMVGGKEKVLSICLPILERLGTDIIHVGDLGAAHALKSLNNLLSATNLIAAIEGTAIAAAAGVDPRIFIDAINVSSGRSHMTTDRFPKYYLPRKFESGFTLGLMYKDICTAMETAKELKVPMLYTSLTQQLYAIGMSKNWAGEDNSKIMLVLEELMNERMSDLPQT